MYYVNIVLLGKVFQFIGLLTVILVYGRNP